MHSSESPATGNGSKSLTNFGMNANLMSSQPQSETAQTSIAKILWRGDAGAKSLGQFQHCDPCEPACSLIYKFNHLHPYWRVQRREPYKASAIDILQKRFGKQQNIISKHMDEILKIPACVSDSASQHGFVYHKIRVNIKSVESLGVTSNQYCSVLTLVLMSKLPHKISVQIATNTAREVWDM